MTQALPIDDPSVLLFNDAFGLTRLLSPKKVKTVRGFATTGPWSIQPALGGPQPRVGVSGKSSSKLLGLPELEAAGSVPYIRAREYAFGHDGKAVYRFDVAVDGEQRAVLFLYRFPIGEISERNVVQRKRFLIGEPLTVTEAPRPFSIGPSEGSSPLPFFRRVWPDGRFVFSRFDRLYGGRIKGRGFSVDWSLEARHDLLEPRTRVLTDEGGVWITGLSRSREEGVVARVELDGGARAWRFPAIEAPAVHRGFVGFRSGPRELTRLSLDAPEARETFALPEEVFALEGGLDPSDLRAAPEIAFAGTPDDSGQALVFEDQLLYLPWHGELLFSATEKKAKDRLIPRKLPPKELGLRSFASRLTARLSACARALGGDLRLSACGLAKGALTIGWSSAPPEGDRFASVCFKAMMNAPLRAYDLSALGRVQDSQRGYVVGAAEPWTEEEVRRGLDTLEAHGVPLKDLASPLNASYHNSNERDPRPAFAPRAAALVAGAILASACGRRERPAVASVKEALALLEAGLQGEDPRTWEGNPLYRDTLERLLSA